jgi:hypothetical protein
METSSGRIQFELGYIGSQWKVPFLIVYGLLQPVLPAALTYPGIPLMRIIAIFRSIGWYLMAPVAIFSFIAAFKSKVLRDKRILIWISSAFLIWVLISSIRAGGDQWDNVRYRAIFTSWMAIIGAWSITQVKEKIGGWLYRIFLIEGVFVLVFLQWYLSRYYKIFGRLGFVQMALIIIIASAIIIIVGFLKDYFDSKRSVKASKKQQ